MRERGQAVSEPSEGGGGARPHGLGLSQPNKEEGGKVSGPEWRGALGLREATGRSRPRGEKKTGAGQRANWAYDRLAWLGHGPD